MASSPATPPTRAAADADGERTLRVAAHRALQGVTDDHAGFRWNTMVAKLMELTNTLMRYRGTSVAGTAGWDEASRLLLLMLAPIAPHIADELWSRRLVAAGEAPRSIHTESWPAFDPALVVADTLELPVQVNGKLRDLVPMAAGLDQAEVERLVLARPKVAGQPRGPHGGQDRPCRWPPGEHRHPVAGRRATCPRRVAITRQRCWRMDVCSSSADRARVFDPASGTSTATGDLTTGLAFQAAAPLPDGRVILVGLGYDALIAGMSAGGSGAAGVDLMSGAEIYDPATGTFSAGEVDPGVLPTPCPTRKDGSCKPR